VKTAQAAQGAQEHGPVTARGWVVDVDGCLMSTDRAGGAGGTPMPGAAAFLTQLSDVGAAVIICTNASEHPPAVYAAHLRDAGLPVTDGQFVTSGSAAALYVAAHHPGAAVLAVGADGLTVPMEEAGVTLADPASGRPADVVVVGAATQYATRAVNAAAVAVAAGAPLYATVDVPWFHGGRGRSISASSLIAHGISWVTGTSIGVLGKPSPALAETLLARLGVPASQVTVVGDAHIETELARHMGARSVLLLSGATRPEQLSELDEAHTPDLVLADISELHQLRLAASLNPTGASS
jgi:NagD protein